MNKNIKMFLPVFLILFPAITLPAMQTLSIQTGMPFILQFYGSFEPYTDGYAALSISPSVSLSSGRARLAVTPIPGMFPPDPAETPTIEDDCLFWLLDLDYAILSRSAGRIIRRTLSLSPGVSYGFLSGSQTIETFIHYAGVNVNAGFSIGFPFLSLYAEGTGYILQRLPLYSDFGGAYYLDYPMPGFSVVIGIRITF